MSRYYTSTRFRPDCPTCGNNLGQLEESFKRLGEQGKTPREALESLGITRLCCRVRALWPVVLPLGGFYLPHHEAATLNYVGIKEQAPQPNLVVLSLRRAASGEHFLISHVDAEGFIGERQEDALTATSSHEPTEVVLKRGESSNVTIRGSQQLTGECEVRIQTEPGEITRGFPYETRAFRRDIEVDRIRSYFDLAPTESVGGGKQQEAVISGPEPQLDQLIMSAEDEPLIAVSDEE